MGALPVILDNLGLEPDSIGQATVPNSLSTDNSNEEDDSILSDGSTTGPNTPEPHLLSPLNTTNNSTWTIESNTTTA
jgi:hypothetical protein